MSNRFLDQYAVILLDMNSTFMFGEGRFGEVEDFYETYVAQGANNLGREAVNTAIRRCYEGMARDYANPEKMDDFPSLAEGLQRYANVRDADVAQLENVFTHHERGQVPPEFAACLKCLKQTHSLGVVSNIWAKKDAWLDEFHAAGIADIWDAMIFSSDGRSIKPSPKLFHQAIDIVHVPLGKILLVGDSLRADIVPAKAIGLDTLWINPGNSEHPMADHVARSLLDVNGGIL